MTVAEWRITDKGWIWITEKEFMDGKLNTLFKVEHLDGNLTHEYAVMFDPKGWDSFAHDKTLWKYNANGLAMELEALELQNCELAYRILTYWRKQGSPRVNQRDPNYAPAWFPWKEAGFTEAGTAAVLADLRCRYQLFHCREEVEAE